MPEALLRPLDFLGCVPGRYAVSTDGRVYSRSHRMAPGEWVDLRLVTPRREPRVRLDYADGRRREKRVALLVLQAAFGRLREDGQGREVMPRPGWALSYGRGGREDCSLRNLRLGPPTLPPEPEPLLDPTALPWGGLLAGVLGRVNSRDGWDGSIFFDDDGHPLEEELRARGFDWAPV